jgi:hypothetical protein
MRLLSSPKSHGFSVIATGIAVWIAVSLSAGPRLSATSYKESPTICVNAEPGSPSAVDDHSFGGGVDALPFFDGENTIPPEAWIPEEPAIRGFRHGFPSGVDRPPRLL